MDRQVWKYDVFLNFRGTDTRKTFTDHLYRDLTRANIRTFRDDGKQLQRGREISFELLKAIEDSRISIIIFSKNYCNSSWCLDELVKIMDCMRTTKQMVFPLFYNVEPSDVRKLRGEFAIEERLVNTYGDDVVNKWRCGLTEAASVAGWDLRGDADGYECELIERVVREVEEIIAKDKIAVLEEEEVKLKQEEEANDEKVKDLQAQLEATKLQAQILSSRRANLVAARSSMEIILKKNGR